jgi:phosphoglycolate phosphatase
VGDLHGRLIAFDLDGTLVDSRRDLAEAVNALVNELGGVPLAEEAIGRMVGEGARVLVDRALRAASLLPAEAGGHNQEVASAFRRKALDRFLVLYDERLLNHTALYDGMRDALEVARRYARLAVLTNKPQRATERVLDGLGLRALFADVIGGDTALPRKPDPAPLEALIARAGATHETTLLVGDSAIDHETALRAGTRCCLASYGYGYEGFPPARLTGSEFIVGAPRDLPAVFERVYGSSRNGSS